MALEVTDLSQQELRSALNVADHLATTLTLHTVESASVWPKFVLPHFEVQGTSLSKLSRIEQLSIVPLVHRESVREWQKFALENQDWLQAGTLTPESVIAGSISSVVYRFDKEEDGGARVPQTGLGLDGKYAPVWQQYPTPSHASIINYDLFSNPSFEQSFNALVQTNSTILSDVVDLGFLFPADTLETKQRSFLMQPVHADFSEASSADDLVGFIVGVIAWDDIFQYVARLEEKVTIVLHNSCGTVLSYEMTGPRTVFLGEGDVHETEFNHLEVAASIMPVMELETIDNDVDVCAYELRVYPTSDFQGHYLSRAPLTYSGIAVLLFFFTAGKFGRYRAKVMMKRELVSLTTYTVLTSKYVGTDESSCVYVL